MARLLFFGVFVFLAKLEEQLQGIGTALRIQPIAATLASTLNERLLRLGIPEQILLHVAAHLVIVGLVKERTIQVINMPANVLHAYTPFTSLDENPQYLLVVSQGELRIEN